MKERTVFFQKNNFYFKRFGTVQYKFDGIEKEVLDFMHRWAFRKSVKNDAAAFSYWFIREQDSMLSMAEKLYGSQHHYWVIMMMNDMLNFYYDWPLSEADLNTYIKDKYGVENIHSVHHHEAISSANTYALPEGTRVSSDYQYGYSSISNYDYESELNEQKRKIKVLKPEYLDEVKAERERILMTDFNRIA